MARLSLTHTVASVGYVHSFNLKQGRAGRCHCRVEAPFGKNCPEKASYNSGLRNSLFRGMDNNARKRKENLDKQRAKSLLSTTTHPDILGQ